MQAELALLGHEVAVATVAKYRGKPVKPPSQNWKTFLRNHAGVLASIDFFTVPTAPFRLLYVLVVMRQERRRVVHFNVTAHPHAAWVAQQLREAFPFDTAPRYLIRDNDSIYGPEVHRAVASMGVEAVRIAPRSPWQNPFVERLIGSIRRDCLNHVIVWDEQHLWRVLTEYFRYYHAARCHQALDGNAPIPREVEPPKRGPVTAIPFLGGLHHRYTRCA